MSTARLDQYPLFIGYDWVVSLQFPTGFLLSGETVRGQFRVSDHHIEGYELTVSRDVDLITLTLPAATTATLAEKDHHVDLVRVAVLGHESPLDVRLTVPAKIISTRPT